MLFKLSFVGMIALLSAVDAFAPASTSPRLSTRQWGYLDDLSQYMAPPEEKEEEIDIKSMNLDKEQVDRYGVGSWDDFVDFEEFDGGDGQMGVAGDGQKGLDKEWKGAAEMAKSKTMSAKNAWGKSTGYADSLISQGMEATRAQQMENWQNQQEVLRARQAHRFMTEEFDKTSGDEDWRSLSNYAGERVDDKDLDAEMGVVTPGSTIYHHIELTSRIGQPQIVEFDITNSFMGYSDFRARFTPETSSEWSVEPTEGSLNGKTGTEFTVKYRPQNPGTSSGYLVIQTEDDKWTFQVTGSASM